MAGTLVSGVSGKFGSITGINDDRRSQVYLVGVNAVARDLCTTTPQNLIIDNAYISDVSFCIMLLKTIVMLEIHLSSLTL